MNGITFAQYVRKQTRTTLATLPNADLLTYMNKVKDELGTAILEKDEDYFLVPETTDLVSGQREYSLPVETASRIKRVEAKLNGTNYIKLEPVSQSQYRGSHDETELVSYFTSNLGGAFYEILRFSIFLYTGTVNSVTDGLRLWAFDYPADINEAQLASGTDLSIDPSTVTFGMPRVIHGVWAERVVIEWKNGQAKPIPLTKDEQNWEFRRDEALKKLTPLNADASFMATVPSVSSRGNSGYDY